MDNYSIISDALLFERSTPESEKIVEHLQQRYKEKGRLDKRDIPTKLSDAVKRNTELVPKLIQKIGKERDINELKKMVGRMIPSARKDDSLATAISSYSICRSIMNKTTSKTELLNVGIDLGKRGVDVKNSKDVASAMLAIMSNIGKLLAIGIGALVGMSPISTLTYPPVVISLLIISLLLVIKLIID